MQVPVQLREGGHHGQAALDRPDAFVDGRVEGLQPAVLSLICIGGSLLRQRRRRRIVVDPNPLSIEICIVEENP